MTPDESERLGARIMAGAVGATLLLILASKYPLEFAALVVVAALVGLVALWVVWTYVERV